MRGRPFRAYNHEGDLDPQLHWGLFTFSHLRDFFVQLLRSLPKWKQKLPANR